MANRAYRLPSEAEWEYACRAGMTTPFAFGSSLSSEQANFDGKHPYGGAAKGVFRQRTTRVGSFSANKFGLFDMHGNVWEWCEDVYHNTYGGHHGNPPNDGSAWVVGGEKNKRVLRGGSWIFHSNHCRAASRYWVGPGNRNLKFGFRVVLSASP